MNPRINKEIRTLLPAFALTALAPLLALPLRKYWSLDSVAGLSMCLAAIGGLAMGVMVFGDEFSNRTMGLLLSQPLPRLKIWRGKMAVLGAAVAVCFAVMALSVYLLVGNKLWQNQNLAASLALLLVLIGFATGVFCTTPFWTLCVKNVLGAAAASFITPATLIILINVLVSYFPRLGWHGDFFEGEIWQGGYFMVATLAVYFAGCYWLGRGMFLKLQVIESQGQEINLPAGLEKALARPLKMMLPGHGGPTKSLINKELHLQRVCFFSAALFCVVFFIGAAGWSLSTSERARELAVVIMACGFAVHFLLVPLIAGGVCVADERNWGTLVYQLALPPSRLRQWIIKVSVAMATSLLLGVFLPLGVYCVCQRLFHVPFDLFTNSDSPFPKLDGPRCLILMLLYLLLTVAAIYASSFTGNTLRAVLATIGLIIAGIVCGFSSFVNQEDIGIRSVITSMVAVLFYQILWAMWNLAVCPVWWLTHSVEKTKAVALWADVSANHHLAAILTAVFAAACLWMVFRFALVNFRQSELTKVRILKQFLIIILLAALMGSIFSISVHAPDTADLPKWTFLPANP